MNILASFERLLLVPVFCLLVGASSVWAQSDPDIRAANKADTYHGAIGVGSWNTTAEFKDIVVTSNGGVLYRSDFQKNGTNGLNILRGNWSVKDGALRQSAIEPQCRVFIGDKNWANYTVNLRARSTGGQEGFSVYFNAQDGTHWTWFNVAGWTNTLASVDQQNGGNWMRLVERVPTVIQTNVWYDVRVSLNGSRFDCYVNSKLVLTGAYSNAPPPENVVAVSEPAAPPAPTADPIVTPKILKPKPLGNGRFPFPKPPISGAIGVGCWNTLVEIRNIVVTSNDLTLYQSDFENDSIDSWNIAGGTWSISEGVLRQSDMQFPCFATTGDTHWANYTLTVQIRKTGGDEGFFVVCGWRDNNNILYLNAGGWGNRQTVIEQRVSGREGHITDVIPMNIETGQWHEVKVVLNDREVSCYLDSNLLGQAAAQVPFSTNAVYLGSSPAPDGHVLKFRAGRQEFEAGLTKDRGGPPALQVGSLVSVSGQLLPDTEPAAPNSAAAVEFQVSPTDIVLIKAPSWWTWRRILWFAGSSFAILTTAAIWIAMISRRNRLLTIAQSELQRANDELEMRVQERTADLARANAALEHEQALLRTLLDNASDYIYFKDTNSRFVRCSISLCKRSGLTPEQIAGKTDFEIFQEEHARSAWEDEQTIIRTGQPLVGKLEKELHPDGRVTWVMTTKMPWHNSNGEIIGTFGISCDITSVKKAEAELERAQKELLQASRAAGMAEVATGVLHNVGNVLNSVNVSTSLLTERLRKSKIELVGRVASLIQDHTADLANFIANDAQGQRVPGFLSDLAEQLTRERASALEELAGLRKNVDHIKEIVAMQQNYATVAGVSTIVKIPGLLEDVLRLTESSLDRGGVKLVKEFDSHLPDINVDHHKVVQILVNLIRNAKHACEDSPQADKQVTLRATGGDGQIKISVIDTGVGIAKENLTRIFAHGFTTRKDGHGFGLHSSALAAKEIGGALRVHSDGPGKGATFILELNLDAKSDRLNPKAPEKEPGVQSEAMVQSNAVRPRLRIQVPSL
jgi:PAS domain S-box-containing protein